MECSGKTQTCKNIQEGHGGTVVGVPAKQKIFEGEEAHQVLCDYFQFALPNPCAAVIEWCNFGYKRINGIIRTRGDASVILESTIGMSSYSQSQRLERYEEFNLE